MQTELLLLVLIARLVALRVCVCVLGLKLSIITNLSASFVHHRPTTKLLRFQLMLVGCAISTPTAGPHNLR